jgi:hypothetical protein
LPGIVGTGAALSLRCIAGLFDAVDGEHFPTDKALPVAQVEDLGEEFGDGVAQVGNEAGDRCVPRGFPSVKCRALSPLRAMKVMCSRQARSIPRLLTMPWLYPEGIS